jgi:hypothetical protein
MKTIAGRITILVLFLSAGLAAAAFQRSAPAAGTPTLEAVLAGYKKWTRLNPEPINMSPAIWSMCRMPSKEETSLVQSDHKDRFISVYANAAGESTMRQAGKRQFPVGTVIVKEKLAKKTDSTPAALGIMIKRSANEWDFAYEEKGKVSTGENVARCRTCHAAQSDRDSVFFPQPFPNLR